MVDNQEYKQKLAYARLVGSLKNIFDKIDRNIDNLEDRLDLFNSYLIGYSDSSIDHQEIFNVYKEPYTELPQSKLITNIDYLIGNKAWNTIKELLNQEHIETKQLRL